MGSSIDLTTISAKLSREDARFEQEKVADLLGRQSLGFPGAQPVSFARKHIEELQRRDYFLCEKTDGIRCLLFLTSFVDESGAMHEVQHLIDRKNDYYCVSIDSLHIPLPSPSAPGYDITRFHSDTLLDGELVLQKTASGQQKLAYLIFDMLAIDGENITARPFDKRYARIDQFIVRPYRKFAQDPRYRADVADFAPFTIQLKTMEMPYGAQMMFKDKIPQLPHGNDGLIFTCVSTPYISGTDPHILKWKPPHENTIDFRLQIEGFPTLTDEETGEEYEDYDAQPEIHLLVNYGNDQGGGHQYFAPLTLAPEEWEAIKRLNQQIDGRIIECYRSSTDGAWRPKLEPDGSPRFRDDKGTANHISTVQSVLESITDAVSEQDLIAAAGRIRHEYKRRQAEREKAPVGKMPQQQGPAQGQGQGKEVVVDDGPSYEE